MVFAAGLGTRMRPLTLHTPKPLLPVGGRSLLDRALDHLHKAGVKRVVVNTHYLAEQVATHLAKRTDLNITLVHEETLLETGGGVKNALPHLGEDPIYVINSDIVWDDGAEPALERLAKAWKPDYDLLLLLVKTEGAYGYDGAGDFDLAPSGQLLRPEPPRPYVFGGVQILKPQLTASVAEPIFSLNRFYFGNPRAFGLVHDSGWYHIGTPEALQNFPGK